MATDTAIVTIEDEQETAPKLSNGTMTLSDLWPTDPYFKVTIIFNIK